MKEQANEEYRGPIWVLHATGHMSVVRHSPGRCPHAISLLLPAGPTQGQPLLFPGYYRAC